jgi:hypothetical protein
MIDIDISMIDRVTTNKKKLIGRLDYTVSLTYCPSRQVFLVLL